MSLENEIRSLGAKSDGYRNTAYTSGGDAAGKLNGGLKQLYKSVGDLRMGDGGGDVNVHASLQTPTAKAKSTNQLNKTPSMRAKLVDIDIGEKLRENAAKQRTPGGAAQAAAGSPLNAVRLRPIRQITRNAVVSVTTRSDRSREMPW